MSAWLFGIASILRACLFCWCLTRRALASQLLLYWISDWDDLRLTTSSNFLEYYFACRLPAELMHKIISFVCDWFFLSMIKRQTWISCFPSYEAVHYFTYPVVYLLISSDTICNEAIEDGMSFHEWSYLWEVICLDFAMWSATSRDEKPWTRQISSVSSLWSQIDHATTAASHSATSSFWKTHGWPLSPIGFE